MGLNILIAMHDGVLRMGLQAIFGSEPQVSNVDVVASKKDLQVALRSNHQDLIVVNQALSTDFALLQGTKFAVMVAEPDKPEIALLKAAYEYGACGYFSSNASAEFLYALLSSEAQSFLLDPTIGAWLMYDVLGRSSFSISNRSLTSREKEIIGLLYEGKDDLSIAHSLHITEKAVEKHIKNIRMKSDGLA
ncbi:MAG TPA: LuxR C-terminal-related transcriptional regulator [Ktedonosporobacter sp.]|jgi:DNA-binding NarL/FixJ family response regulator|nr:LuxR C-terminal-related transcriptional regulator [Ktedonosporobacter sp.]